MTTTTLTFLVILLSITTLAFFILSIFAIRRSNKHLDSVLEDYKKLNLEHKGLLNIIDNADRKISELTGESIRKDKLIDELDFKLKDELRFQEEQIQKQKDILTEEYEEKITSLNHQIDSSAKDNKELLNLIENLEKISNERLEEIKRLTNT